MLTPDDLEEFVNNFSEPLTKYTNEERLREEHELRQLELWVKSLNIDTESIHEAKHGVLLN